MRLLLEQHIHLVIFMEIQGIYLLCLSVDVHLDEGTATLSNTVVICVVLHIIILLARVLHSYIPHTKCIQKDFTFLSYALRNHCVYFCNIML